MNVVFDLGGVVFHWAPDEIIADVFESKEIQDKVKRHVFEHTDWVELDRGTLEQTVAIQNAASRTGLPKSDIIRLMNCVPESLIPIPETVELIRQIKQNGNRLFVLSNMHVASIRHLRAHYIFWDLFDGVVVSSDVHMVKPELDIYQYLLDCYKIQADETIFIDDMPINLEAAEKMGIKEIRFKDSVQCGQELKLIGCL